MTENSSPATQTEPVMVQTEILYSGVSVVTVYLARIAIETVMGGPRKTERQDFGPGQPVGWLIEFTEGEYAVLGRQGFIELEKGPYTIRAEMP